jgi:hypothetical protein
MKNEISADQRLREVVQCDVSAAEHAVMCKCGLGIILRHVCRSSLVVGGYPG